jgi:hypothetical protein
MENRRIKSETDANIPAYSWPLEVQINKIDDVPDQVFDHVARYIVSHLDVTVLPSGSVHVTVSGDDAYYAEIDLISLVKMHPEVIKWMMAEVAQEPESVDKLREQARRHRDALLEQANALNSLLDDQ